MEYILIVCATILDVTSRHGLEIFRNPALLSRYRAAVSVAAIVVPEHGIGQQPIIEIDR